ncbi:MAG TPA: uroporphyrinogen-III synthase [Chloroflexia bacterium]|nr:uroporphyrinogen-III synthase [Chloroflexia bacterium]
MQFSSPSIDNAAYPLQGKRVVVTRAREQSKGLVEQLQSLGAEVVESPAITIAPPETYAPVDEAIIGLDRYDWVIFTSANAVEAFTARLAQISRSMETLSTRKLCAVGPATAAAINKLGCKPALVPTAYLADAVIEEIGDVKGHRILLPAADIARKTLGEGLRSKGAHVDEVTVYRTTAGDGGGTLADLLSTDKVDAVTFTSSSTVRNTVDNLASRATYTEGAVRLLNRAKVVCIGPVTAGTAQELGVRVDAVASEHTAQGLVAALVALFAGDTEGKTS